MEKKNVSLINIVYIFSFTCLWFLFHSTVHTPSQAKNAAALFTVDELHTLALVAVFIGLQLVPYPTPDLWEFK